MLKGLLIALSFLTIFPLKTKGYGEKELRNSVVFFPFVGFAEGVFLATMAKYTGLFFSSFLVSAFLITGVFCIRGIFHVDGLSDTFDALFYKGSGDYERDIKKRLEIMKDSTTGVGGVTAVVVSILLKFVLLREIVEYRDFFALIAIFSLSRWFIIPVMYFGKPASTTGLGAIFLGKISKKNILIATLLPLALVTYFLLLCKNLFLIVAIITIYGIIMLIKRSFERVFSGLTGDNLGAIIEISEILLLLAFLLENKVWLNL